MRWFLLIGSVRSGKENQMGTLLKGQSAIVTGSGQGIGRDLALYMAREGCQVIVNNRTKGSSPQAHDGKVVKLNAEDLERINKIIGDCETTAEMINSDPEVIAAGGKAVPVYADISKPEDCKKLVDAAIENFGKLEILVNNAAAHWTGNLKEMKIENWEVCVRSKLDSSFYLTYYALPHMVKQKYGRILLASSDAQVGLEGMCGYSAACGGVVALTRSWAQDLLEDGITVNAYTPNAGTRSWLNVLAEFREEGYDVEAIDEGAPPGQKYPAERMIPFLGFICSDEFKGTGLVFSVCADGELAVWGDLSKKNKCFKDLWADGAWTIDELRELVPNELLKGVYYSKSTLAITKGSYD